MSEIETNPKDNKTLEGESVQQTRGNGRQKSTPSVLEKAREWTREHPITTVVGSLAAGAAVAVSALTLNSSEKDQGTTITTTQEVENPDGSREVIVEETFIPESPTQESTEAGEPESENDNTEEISSPERIPGELTEAQSLAEEKLVEMVENNTEERTSSDPEERVTMSWRGLILFESVNDEGERLYGVMRDPLELALDEKVYYVAYHPETGQLLSKQTGRINVGEVVLGDVPNKVMRFSYEGNPDSGQRVTASPLSFDGSGVTYQDNYDQILRGLESHQEPTVELFSNREAALESAQFGEELIILSDDDWEQMHRDFEAATGENA